MGRRAKADGVSPETVRRTLADIRGRLSTVIASREEFFVADAHPGIVRLAHGTRAGAPPGKNHRVGQCFSTACSADGANDVSFRRFYTIRNAWRKCSCMSYAPRHGQLQARPWTRVPRDSLSRSGGMTATLGRRGTARAFQRAAVEDAGVTASHAGYASGREETGNAAPEERAPSVWIHGAETARQWIERGLPPCPCGARQ